MLGVRHISPNSVQHFGASSPGSSDGIHIVATQNRWSRIVLTFADIVPDAWYEFSCRIRCHQDEAAQSLRDFAVLGIDFQTEDGSSIDFVHVPGLTRGQIDPFSDYIPGPALQSPGRDPIQAGKNQHSFLVPAPTKQLTLTIRGWRNTLPFEVIDPILRQSAELSACDKKAEQGHGSLDSAQHEASYRSRCQWKTLTPEPTWFRYAVVPSHSLFVRGQIIDPNPGEGRALARIIFRDAQGREIAPPYPGTLTMPAVGAFIDIPTHIQARRFTLELIPPPRAATAEVGFQTWQDAPPVTLVLPLEISLGSGLLLEDISGEELRDATGFLRRLFERLGTTSPITESDEPASILARLLDSEAVVLDFAVHHRLRDLKRNEDQETSDRLRLSSFPGWRLPEEPSWMEDPFRSPAWRLEFHSLEWLLDMAGSLDPGSAGRAFDLALSWSRANPWGQPSDPLNVHPAPMATRTTALLKLLALSAGSEQKVDPRDLLHLLGEVIRHCFALSEIIGQNVFSHSIHQVYAASALLAAAEALPRIPLSNYWSGLALTRLQEGFDDLFGQDGAWSEQSQLYRLELLSIGLILHTVMEGLPEAEEFRQHLSSRLEEAASTIISLIDPDGMLPPFGDVAHNYHHASWIRRLVSQYGRMLLRSERIRNELSYPEGSRIFAAPRAGIIAAKYYEHGRKWGNLCATFSEQRTGHGHYDCTSFIFSSKGVKWITDPGGAGEYERGPISRYLTSSHAHNVAIPDGRQQSGGAGWLQLMTSVGGANIIEIGSNVHGPDYVHRRTMVSMHDLSAVAVFDHFSTWKRELSFEGFVHFDPEVILSVASPRLIKGFRDQQMIQITPLTVTGRFGGFEISQGVYDRAVPVQGFVSFQGELKPAAVLRYRFWGQEGVCGGLVIATDEISHRAILNVLGTTELRALLAKRPVD